MWHDAPRREFFVEQAARLLNFSDKTNRRAACSTILSQPHRGEFVPELHEHLTRVRQIDNYVN